MDIFGPMLIPPVPPEESPADTEITYETREVSTVLQDEIRLENFMLKRLMEFWSQPLGVKEASLLTAATLRLLETRRGAYETILDDNPKGKSGKTFHDVPPSNYYEN